MKQLENFLDIKLKDIALDPKCPNKRLSIPISPHLLKLYTSMFSLTLLTCTVNIPLN